MFSLYKYHIVPAVKGQWSQPMHMNLGVPTPRAAHGMCAVDGNLYIFGGRDIEDRQNDLHIFNIGEHSYMLYVLQNGL